MTWLDILILIISIVCILLVYEVLTYLIKRASKTGKIPLEVVNGLKLLLRLVTAVVIIIVIVTHTQLPTEVTIAISAIFGTVIGFASIQAIQNFISGLYIIITRPFGVLDLVSVGGHEGIVTEISLNYTKLVTVSGKRLLIANRNVLNSNIVNYTREIVDISEDEDTALEIIKHIITGKEITRYTFSLNLPRTDPIQLKRVLKELVEAWKPVFGYDPECMLWQLNYFAVYRFILITDLPETILKQRPLFIQDVYQRVFGTKN